MELNNNLPEELKEKYDELKNDYFDNYLFGDLSKYENFYYEVVGKNLVAVGYTVNALNNGVLKVPDVFDMIDFKMKIDAPDIIQDGSGVMSVDLGRMMILPSGCFRGWVGLREVIGNCVLQIGKSTFEDCLSLRTITFPVVSAIDENAFANCSNLLELNFPLLRVTGAGAFNGCKNVVKADIHNVKELAPGVLANCEKLVDLNISNCVLLGEESLALCVSLEILNIRLCRAFRKGALKGCANLHTLFLDNIIGMEADSLSMCTNLQLINYYGSKDRWEQLVVESNTEVDILRRVQMMYDYKDIKISNDEEV